MSVLRSSLISCSAALVLFAVVAGGPTAVFAGDRFQPPSSKELAMKSEPLAPGAPAIILFRQVDRDDNSAGTLTPHEEDYVRIKILTQEGLKYSSIAIPFDKSREDIMNVKARAIRPDGSIIDFDGKVTEQSYDEHGVETYAKTFTLPGVPVGGIVEYYYTVTYNENNLYESHWILSQRLFTKDARFQLKTYRPPSGKVTVSWSWQHLPAGTSPPHEDPDRFVRLEARNVPAFQKEEFMPPENELKSRVDFVYSYDAPEGDNDKYWKQVGKKLYEDLEHFTNKHDAMKDAVDQTVSQRDSQEVKLQKIYARVQKLQNTSYETGAAEAQNDKRDNNNVEGVWSRGYGSAGELNWLYLALVRAAGFDAHGIWVSDRGNYFFDHAQREAYKLDANAVVVKLHGKEIYCAPGTKFAPFGLLPWTETGVEGLQLDKDGGNWIKTPVPPDSMSRMERKADLQLSDAGDLKGNLRITFTGFEAIYRRTQASNQNEAKRKKYLEDQVRSYVPAAAEVELTNKPNWSDPSVPLVAEFNLTVPDWASTEGRRVSVPVGFFSGLEKHRFEPAERIHPIYVAFPYQTIDDITLVTPPGWRVNALPTGLSEDGHVITYSMKVENDKSKIHVTRTLDTNFVILEAKYYPALRTFYQQVRAGDKQQIVLQSGATTASK